MKLLDNAQAFNELMTEIRDQVDIPRGKHRWKGPATHGVLCPQCGGPRRTHGFVMLGGPGSKEKSHVPSLCIIMCLQCDTSFTAVLYETKKGTGYALLPSRPGGLTTPNTPSAVAYYLDQAHKSAAVGANSAAIAMFRAALEHVLYGKDFTMKMLGPKIDALEEQINSKTAERWAMDLDPEMLRVLKKLGDAAIHPNDGNIERQNTLDSDLVMLVKLTFAGLLDLVYEAEARRKEHLTKLKGALDKTTA